MRPTMVPDGVALGGDTPDKFGKFGGRLADEEEGGSHALLRERGKYLLRVRGLGPSSNVSTTSWSAKGKVCGKLFRPTGR